MANPRQRRKARSASSLKPSLNAKRQMKKRLVRAPTVHGPDVLKDNYDPKLTLRQNYARLGLIPSLDVRPDSGANIDVPVRKGMARVVRDAQGNIINIIEPPTSIDDQDQETTAWGKPLATSIADEKLIETYMPPSKQSNTTNGAGRNQVVEQLEIMAAKAQRVQRHTSSFETQWLKRLVEKYGSDTEAMAKDRKLNIWQKTQGEIKRAINKAGGFEFFFQS
uniref:Nucleolar protein 16 n=1 Tax=Melanopsichium pennsylvanicum 4 TaxID=1398559 RepID=A0A077QXC7_9BASI|nr:ribosomal large subunit biogenesis-related protein [Melanopsichium pennsylvanicum 4]